MTGLNENLTSNCAVAESHPTLIFCYVIFIATKDGLLKIESLQFPGKKRMLAHELLNGVKLSENAIAL